MFKKNILLLIIFLFCVCVPEALSASFTVGGIRFNKDIKSLHEIRRKNIVTQSLDFSCGAAGLSTLFNYYLAEPTSEKEIIGTILESVSLEKVKQRKGFSLLDLKTFAESKGYKATGYKMDVSYLRELQKPVLVPIKFKNYRHFVIVKGVVADRVFIADPAVGNMTMKIPKFESIWSNGIALLIERPEDELTLNNQLHVLDNDLILADYRNLRRIAEHLVYRTAVYTTEFK